MAAALRARRTRRDTRRLLPFGDYMLRDIGPSRGEVEAAARTDRGRP